MRVVYLHVIFTSSQSRFQSQMLALLHLSSHSGTQQYSLVGYSLVGYSMASCTDGSYVVNYSNVVVLFIMRTF